MKKKTTSFIIALIIVLNVLCVPAGAASGGATYTSGLGFSLTIPAGWAGKYHTMDFSVAVEFINTRNEKAGYGGFLFSVMIQDNLEPLDWNGVRLLGESGGMYYFGSVPSDVQFDYYNKSLRDEYQSMEKDVEGIFKSFRILNDAPAGKLKIFVDGAELFPDAEPFIDANGRTMAPVRFIGEAMGGKVDWNPVTQTATITKGQTVVKLVVGSKIITTNGKQAAMDTVAIVKDGRTFVPVRFIAEALGLAISWDDKTQTVKLTSGGQANAGAVKSGLLAGCWETSDRGEPRRIATINGKIVTIREDWKALEFDPDDGEAYRYWERGFKDGKWTLLCLEGYADYDGERLYLFTVSEKKYESAQFEGLKTPSATKVYPVVQATVYNVDEWDEDFLMINGWDDPLYNFAGKSDKPPRVW